MTTVDQVQFRYANPFTLEWVISQSDLDDYQHVNNVAYLAVCEKLAWQHSESLGLGMDTYQEMNRGMVIVRHEIDYVNSAYLGDTLQCATWICESDQKMRIAREFQFIRPSDGKEVLRAKTFFVCVELSSGKIKRLPALFRDTYGNVLVNQD
ncbi:MAG: acyl-CoA thioesterase [Alteromonadaceae bacterium]|nr:acyl-CoA thioesterase [Alteromonadaceae bacterium]